MGFHVRNEVNSEIATLTSTFLDADRTNVKIFSIWKTGRGFGWLLIHPWTRKTVRAVKLYRPPMTSTVKF